MLYSASPPRFLLHHKLRPLLFGFLLLLSFTCFVSHRLSPSSSFSTYCSACEWLGLGSPVLGPAAGRSKQGGRCLCWQCHSDLLGGERRGAPDAAPSLPQTARSCCWNAGISERSVCVSCTTTPHYCSFSSSSVLSARC